jgi:hypothetical protein
LNSLLAFGLTLMRAGCGAFALVRLVLFAERENRYVYKLAEAYLPLRATHKGTFQFFVPPITVRLSLVYVTSLSR